MMTDSSVCVCVCVCVCVFNLTRLCCESRAEQVDVVVLHVEAML